MTSMQSNDEFLHAGLLFQAVESLGARFACERSTQFRRGVLLPNRYLLTVTKEAIQRNAEDAIVALCRRIHMAEPVVETMCRDLSAAKFVHFGFEEDEARVLYKMYLEFGFDNPTAGVPILMHRAFKWDIADPMRHVVTEYLWHPALTVDQIAARLAEVYRAGDDEALAIARGILERAEAAMPRTICYLEVTEETTRRRSFDLNFYDAKLLVKDLGPWLRRLAAHLAIPTDEFEAWYEPVAERRFGHLAGGVHRAGQDFFNLYYGVEWHDRKSRPSRAGWAMKTVERFEYTTGQDQYFNYCWWPYLPVAPVEDKFRPVNLLFKSFELAGLDERAYDLVRRIQEAIGQFRTVFGVKWLPDGRLGWEFYFYDYQRRDREVSISRVLEAIRPLVRCDVPVNESLPYFMFSLDVSNDLVRGERPLDVVHMYIGNPGSRVSSGISYALTAQETTLENFYFFFEALRDLRQAADKVLCSAHVDSARIDIDAILRPELRNCHTICIANKQKNDTAYFSGVNVEQLLFFLKLLQYPAEIIAFVETNRAKLDHLLYDVGFDYVARGSELVILRSGYYGVF